MSIIKYVKILIVIGSLLNTSNHNIFAQEKTDLTPETIIDNFIEKIGGEKWRNLKSRKEFAFVQFQEDENSIIPIKSYDRIKINADAGKAIEVHQYATAHQTIMTYKPDCNWYYSGRSQVVKFFGPEPITFKNLFPKTELMEVLNLEPMKKVYQEDTLFRIDFKDQRQIDGKHSLFFGMHSGLLYRRGYTSKNEVRWEYHFSEYRESQGFSEPYRVKLTSNGAGYIDLVIKSIEYDTPFDPKIFDPPIPCKNYDDFTNLEFPFVLKF